MTAMWKGEAKGVLGIASDEETGLGFAGDKPPFRKQWCITAA